VAQADDKIQQFAQAKIQLVDQLTPNGQLPSGDVMAQGLGMLKGFMKS
jgi:uncharacterized protein YidB (DUF937 family)